MKRLRKKKLPTIVLKMKKIHNRFGSWQGPDIMTRSKAHAQWSIVSDQPAPIDITKRVNNAFTALSKVKE